MKIFCIFSLITFVISGSINAQKGWGITAGANLSSMKVNEETTGYEEARTEYDPVVRFQAGIFKEIVTARNIVITPGLLFIKKGYKTRREDQLSGQQRDWRFSYSPSYIQLPVDIAYRFHMANDQCFDAGIGLYASYGIGGRAYEKIKLDGEVVKDEDYKLEFLNETKVTRGEYSVTTTFGYSRPIDIGGGLVANYHFNKKLGIKLNADHSFFNLQSKINGNKPVSTRYNQQLRLSFSYIFL
ncbi:outer membrane beta-barrel protein [Niabella sp. CJ426]|uniref:outer membrane beta-barrel protein n=1 Tax=Niabella sp. CJ426 TaxID=3393740 RepID=UPI003D02DC93